VGGLSLELSKALRVSLSEVRDQYFGGSVKERGHIMLEELDRCTEHQRYEEGQRRNDEEEHQEELQSYDIYVCPKSAVNQCQRE
jgi:hypothetical protein